MGAWVRLSQDAGPAILPGYTGGASHPGGSMFSPGASKGQAFTCPYLRVLPPGGRGSLRRGLHLCVSWLQSLTLSLICPYNSFILRGCLWASPPVCGYEPQDCEHKRGPGHCPTACLAQPLLHLVPSLLPAPADPVPCVLRYTPS